MSLGVQAQHMLSSCLLADTDTKGCHTMALVPGSAWFYLGGGKALWGVWVEGDWGTHDNGSPWGDRLVTSGSTASLPTQWGWGRNPE